MGVDVPGHRGQPFAVHDLQPRSGGIAGGDRRDASAFHHDGPLVDDLTGAHDDADVGDGEVLGGEIADADRASNKSEGKKNKESFHGVVFYFSGPPQRPPWGGR